MLSALLTMAFAGAPAAGGFNGGAFAGLHAGFMHHNVKTLAKDAVKDETKKEVSKDDADALYDSATKELLAASAKATVVADAKDKAYTDAKVGLSNDKKAFVITYDATGDADSTKAQEAIVKAVQGNAKNFTKDTKISIIVTKLKNGTDANVSLADAAAAAKVKGFVTKADWSKNLVDSTKVPTGTPETKMTANTGLIGLHVGYLHRMNQFGLGALLEGHWAIGSDFKQDSTSLKDVKARFGVNALLRAVYFLSSNAFVGADLGVGFQEIRYPKAAAGTAEDTSKKDNKDSKWLWGPMARGVVGFAINENMVVTLTAGGLIPVKQDWTMGGETAKVKYFNLQGNVGFSYYFG